MKSLLLLSLFLGLQTAAVSANTFVMNSRCKKAYSDAFHLKFSTALQLLNEEQKEDPENTAVHYIYQYIDFLRAFISEEEQDFEKLKKNIDHRLKLIEKVDSKNPWRDLARGEMMLQQAVVKLKWGEYFSSGLLIRKSYKLLEENYQKNKNFTPNLKSLGFFHAVIGSVPENYKWMANLVGMHGTISEGASELNTILNFTAVTPEFRFMYDEVFFLRIFVATHFEKKPGLAISLLEKQNNKTNFKSSLQQFIETNTLISTGNFDKALQSINAFNAQKETYPLYYLDYMKGILLLNKLDSNAANYFRKYVNNYKGNSFIKSSWHKLAWLDLMENNAVGFRKNMSGVLQNGNEFTDEDKQASKDASSGVIPNIHLLRARLLFDGGDYNNALAELTGKSQSEFPNMRDQIEYTYRLARIFDKKEQKDIAIKYYTITYTNGKNKEWYFGANAALMLGLTYEELNDYPMAKEWYKKCLALRNHEYQNSIDQKAEAGLNRLGRLP